MTEGTRGDSEQRLKLREVGSLEELGTETAEFQRPVKSLGSRVSYCMPWNSNTSHCQRLRETLLSRPRWKLRCHVLPKAVCGGLTSQDVQEPHEVSRNFNSRASCLLPLPRVPCCGLLSNTEGTKVARHQH